MAHAYYHAKSSARKFGGAAEDYLEVHEFMDHTKMHLADCRHRLFLHNTWGITIIMRILGTTYARPSDGVSLSLRPILELHITKDMGHILHCKSVLKELLLPHGCIEKHIHYQDCKINQKFRRKVKGNHNMQRVLTPEEITQLAKDYEALARWEQVQQFVYALYGNAAYSIKVETTLPYNDEYFEDAAIERIVVYDQSGKEIEPDLTLPFWRQEMYEEQIEQAIHDDELDMVLEEIMEEVQQ